MNAAYETSTETGHGDWPGRTTSEGSGNVFINGKKAHRKTDGWPTHCNSLGECHTGVTAKGSNKVFINGLPAARIGDPLSCGGTIATGSPNVMIGG